jgi:hypothetical protein
MRKHFGRRTPVPAPDSNAEANKYTFVDVAPQVEISKSPAQEVFSCFHVFSDNALGDYSGRQREYSLFRPVNLVQTDCLLAFRVIRKIRQHGYVLYSLCISTCWCAHKGTVLGRHPHSFFLYSSPFFLSSFSLLYSTYGHNLLPLFAFFSRMASRCYSRFADTTYLVLLSIIIIIVLVVMGPSSLGLAIVGA